MKILFMSQMPPHSNQSGNSSVEQLRQINEPQSSISVNTNGNANIGSQSADFYSSYLPSTTQVDDITFEQSVFFDNLIMTDFDPNDDELLMANDMSFKLEVMEMPGLMGELTQGDETTTLISTAVNPASLINETQFDMTNRGSVSTVPTQLMNSFGVTNNTNTNTNININNNNNNNNNSTPPDSFRRLAANVQAYGLNQPSMLPSSTTTSGMINTTTTNNHNENQRMTSTANIIDTKHIKQEYIHHDDSNSSSATALSEPAFSSTHRSRTYDSNNPASVSPSIMENYPRSSNGPSTSGLAHRRSHTKKQQSEEIIYGPITVRPRKNPAPTLASGRKSKSIVLSEDEARKREVRRQRNRNAADKCKQKRAIIEDTLHNELKRLRDEQTSIANDNERLMAVKRRLLEISETHVCNEARASIQQLNYNQQPLRLPTTASAVPVMNTFEPSTQQLDGYHSVGYTVPQQNMPMYQQPQNQNYGQQAVGQLSGVMMANPNYSTNGNYDMVQNMNLMPSMPPQQPQQQTRPSYHGQQSGLAYIQSSQQQQVVYQQPHNQMYQPPQYNN